MRLLTLMVPLLLFAVGIAASQKEPVSFDKLSGAVREIQTAKAILREDGTEVNRVLEKRITLDRSGKELEVAGYEGSKALLWKAMFFYDTSGLVAETISYSANGSVIYRSVWSYKEGGRQAKVVQKGGDGSIIGWDINIYGSDNLLLEETRYTDKGERVSRVGYKYDSKGNLTEKILDGLHEPHAPTRWTYRYDTHGKLIEDAFYYGPTAPYAGRRVFLYDKKRQTTEELFYDGEGSLKDRIQVSYELDSMGNWIKKTRYKQWQRDGKSELVPAEVLYRTIEYY